MARIIVRLIPGCGTASGVGEVIRVGVCVMGGGGDVGEGRTEVRWEKL